MTGFGVGVARLGSGRVHVEVRSLNHRYLDVRVRVPDDISEHALFVEQTCREKLSRGRYDVSVHLSGLADASVRLDRGKSRAAYQSFVELRDELAPGQEVPLALLGTVPELFTKSFAIEAEQARAALAAACRAAIERLLEMRQVEGQALRADLLGHLERTRALADQIAERSDTLVAAYRERLRDRVTRLLADARVQVDPGRLELEIAVLAEKTDVAEELARLASHFQQFEMLADKQEPVGRALDFLLQEIARETNTIGSKCQDANVSHRVVELKSEIERIREQVQNVE
jgi:uncharacterized protein (TIGR00255 family)